MLSVICDAALSVSVFRTHNAHLKDVEDLAKGGMMDNESKTKKSKGLFGDMSDVFGALSGGAHIVRREDGTL